MSNSACTCVLTLSNESLTIRGAQGGLGAQVTIMWFEVAKLLQKSEMRKDIVIELSYKGFG